MLQGRASAHAPDGRARRDYRFEGKTLYGILRHPLQRFHRSPVLIMAPGLDSTKEELHAYAEPFLARGIAIVAIDGPRAGRGGVRDPDLRRLRARRARGVRLDGKRADLDAANIGHVGVSLGGYYAPHTARAAALVVAADRDLVLRLALPGPSMRDDRDAAGEERLRVGVQLFLVESRPGAMMSTGDRVKRWSGCRRIP